MSTTTDNDHGDHGDPLMRPILGHLSRQLQRIQQLDPYALTVPEIMGLLGALQTITDRLDPDETVPDCQVVPFPQVRGGGYPS